MATARRIGRVAMRMPTINAGAAGQHLQETAA
jgi:hypothetical protein